MTSRMAVVVVGILLLAGAVLAQEEEYYQGKPWPLGKYCWRMVPFADTITTDWTYLIDDFTPQRAFYVSMQWDGCLPGVPCSYQMKGAGTIIHNDSQTLDGEVYAMAFTLRQRVPFAFGGHPVCLMNAIPDATLAGAWSAECRGLQNGGGTPFLVAGTLEFIGQNEECPAPGQIGIVQSPSLRAMSEQGIAPTLAGFR